MNEHRMAADQPKGSDATEVSSAYCPAHVSCFFTIDATSPNPFQKGSVGAGFSLEKGVTAIVKLIDKPGIQVVLNGGAVDFPTVKTVVEHYLDPDTMLPDTPSAERLSTAGHMLGIHVSLLSELPLSQGFGLSGACALATSYALSKLLPNYRTPAEIAHLAELENSTGLGDVPGQTIGGFEARISPGVPPHGEVVDLDPTVPAFLDEHRFTGIPVLLCVLGEHVGTKNVLEDQRLHELINYAGKESLDALMHDKTLENLCIQSNLFAERVGFNNLKTERTVELIRRYNYGITGRCMLGNSIFVFGKVERLKPILEPLGEVFVTKITSRGAHLLE